MRKKRLRSLLLPPPGILLLRGDALRDLVVVVVVVTAIDVREAQRQGHLREPRPEKQADFIVDHGYTNHLPALFDALGPGQVAECVELGEGVRAVDAD